MKFKQANTYTIQCMGKGITLKVKEITHDLNHDLTFYCTHNQLCVPQYKVNVYSTWDIKLCRSPTQLNLNSHLCGNMDECGINVVVWI